MFSEKLKKYAESQYEERLGILGETGRIVEEKMKSCTPDEQILMKFLYGTMPVRDAGEYEFEVFLGYVRHSLMVYTTMDWCRDLSEEIFINHVLYYRINSENIVDCRRFFYDQLIDRIRGLSAKEAALEINYWCAENGSYEASDRRTISPVTLYKSGKGRCGEESTFAVTAFRSVGIPARQVYTPRWAHCDDNHAWVEVYVDGKWHFLGACEPEEILDKGWFSSASSRALLVHSRSFSDFMSERKEGCLGKQELLYYYNHTDTYARTKNLQVNVLDGEKRPVSGANVAVQILNGADLFDAATLTTDEEGKASIILGLGTIRLAARKDDWYCEKKLNVREQGEVILELRPEKEFLRESSDWEAFYVEAPADYPMNPGKLTREQKEKNRKRIRECGKIREERINSYYLKEKAEKYPDLQEILHFSGGNFDELIHFLEKDGNPDRKELLKSLVLKDSKDASADILEAHLEAASEYREKWVVAGKYDIYVKYILCPRIFFEELKAWRKPVLDAFNEEEKKRFAADPMEAWSYVQNEIRYVPELDYSTIYTTPEAALKLKICNPLDKKITFVAICRALGIPARINPVNLEAEYYKDGHFISTEAEKVVEGEDESAEIRLLAKEGDPWSYNRTWPIGRLQNGHYETLNYLGIRFEDGKLDLTVRPGAYRILTSNRLPSGNQLAMEYRFCIKNGEKKEIEMKLESVKTEDMLVSNQLEDFDVTKDGKTPVSVLSVMGEGMNIAAFLSEGEEPTEHVLNEILESSPELEKCGADIWFIFRDEHGTENKTVKKVLDRLPGIHILYADFDSVVEPLARRMYVDPEKLPLLLLLKPGLLGIYGTSGYHVGSVELALKLLEYNQQMEKM